MNQKKTLCCSFRLSFYLRILLLGLLFIRGPVALASDDFSLEIHKSERLLLLKKNNLLQRSYKISLGRGGKGHKLKRGDLITPVGSYRIVGFKEESRFHLFMQLNYPNSKDALHGLRQSVIEKEEFDRIITQHKNHQLPDQTTPLGGAIGIHGIGEQTEERIGLHLDENWTEGCIALTNEEIEELRGFVDIGTRVIIFH